MNPPLAAAAARNNAEWCDAMCRAHGLPGEFGPRTWTNTRRTPSFYPDAVTLTAAASAVEVVSRIDTAAGCSVKDSFACLDLTTAGFAVLFAAQWIHWPRRCRTPTPPRGVRWAPVRTPDALLAWERAWGRGDEPVGLFRPELLADSSVLILAGRVGTQITTGAVANRGASLIGISNVFTANDDLDAAWDGALSATTRHSPGLPITGYERGEALAAAVRHGGTPIGSLRIWHRAASVA